MAKKKAKNDNSGGGLRLMLAPHRMAMGWSQMDLAERLDTSDATIGRIEAGKQNWKQDFLLKAARVLGVHWFDLLPPEEHPLLAAWDAADAVERQALLTGLRAKKRGAA
jgi:transcriptional regulator with XRE-family HTH domain